MPSYSFAEIVGLELAFNPATDTITFPAGYSAGALTIVEYDQSVHISYGAQLVVLLGVTYDQLRTANFSFFTNPLGSSSVVVFGTAAGEAIAGTSAGDYIEALGGNDTITISAGGIDKVFGGLGDDTIIAGASFTRADRLTGGAGFDTLMLQGSTSVTCEDDTLREIEAIRAGAGSNYALRTAATTLAAGATMQVIAQDLGVANIMYFDGTASAGSFAFTGGAGNDQLYGGSGNDSYNASLGGSDLLSGGAGNDYITMGTSLEATDRISGGLGTDTLNITGLNGGALFALTSTILQGVEAVVLRNGYDYRMATADAVTDAIAGTEFTVDAGVLGAAYHLEFDGSAETAQKFRLIGGAGADVLIGGAAADYFDLRYGGNDTATGGSGDDTFYFADTYTNADTIIGGAGTWDVVVLRGDYTAAGTLTFANSTGIEAFQLVGSFVVAPGDGLVAAGQRASFFTGSFAPGQSVVIDGSAETNGSFELQGGTGNDTLVGSQNADLIHGNDGNDAITGGPGGDQLFGDGGDDTFVLLVNEGETLFGGTGTDTVSFAGASSGTSVNLTQLNSVEVIVGSAFADTIIGPSAFQAQTVEGGSGADSITLTSFTGDRVVYRSVSDSAAGAGNYDTVTFFSTKGGALDYVDLSAIDANSGTGANDAFTFIGGAAFNGVAGELRFTGGNDGFLLGDVNGDAVADLQIRIVSSIYDPVLTVANLVL